MPEGKKTRRELARLERVLDTFGADSGRWPAGERSAMEAFVAKNTDASRLLDEARALERIMNAASVLQAGTSLKSRIVSAAIEDTSRDTRIVPLEPARHRKAQPKAERRAASIWPAAALAASFALGLYLGVADIGGTALDGVFEIAMSQASSGDADSISWLEGSAAANEDGPL